MLVITRKLDEKIYITPEIFVQIVDIDRGKIRLGISCPREMVVFREEIATPEQLAAIAKAKEREDGR